MNKKKKPVIDGSTCAGCSACVESCPILAITMKGEDENG